MSATTGETDLARLLASLTTTIHQSHFLFISLPQHATLAEIGLPLSAIEASIHEAEGLTVILAADAAKDHGLAGIYPCRKITLNVHSSLEAVGFMAVITARLTKAAISCNPVSGYYHDHLFVPEEKVEETIRILENLAEESRTQLGEEKSR